MRKLRKVARLDAQARHKLRIGVKKLRYACEFFASVFTGGKRDGRRRRMCKVLRRLQGHLGTLNDIEVHKRFAHALASADGTSVARSREALAMGFITGQEAKHVASCLASVQRAAAKLDDLRAYWK